MADAVGVAVMAYGSPRSLDGLAEYYTHIRRGRPPTEDQLGDLRRRYEAIGGLSPLAAATEAQRAAIADALAGGAPGPYRVMTGAKHAAPFIEDAVDELAVAGVTRLVGLVLAPHYSRASVGAYHERAAQAARTAGVDYHPIDSWHLEDAYLDFQARRVAAALETLPERTKVLFTAHSLPERALADDPYPDQLDASAQAIARRVGLRPWPDWALAWQSAGRTPEPWRGPDVLDVIRTLAATGRSDGVLVCPQGFVSEHLEVRYDLDIEAAGVAREVGLEFARTPTVGDDPAVMAALAELARARAEG